MSGITYNRQGAGITYEEGMPLQEWMNLNPENRELGFQRAGTQQQIFVRDNLHPLFIFQCDLREDFPVRVVGEHYSKSVLLPVYALRVPDIMEARLRGNFFNWILTVRRADGKRGRVGWVDGSIAREWERTEPVLHVYAEGFTNDWVLPPYRAADPQGFSMMLSYHEHQLFTFLYILTENLGLHTKW